MKKAMIDVAYEQLSTKKKPVTLLSCGKKSVRLWDLHRHRKKNNIAQFYSDLSLDDRFVCVGENKWDLRERHTYNEVVVDTSEILIDEDEDDTDSHEDDIPPLKTTEEDY